MDIFSDFTIMMFIWATIMVPGTTMSDPMTLGIGRASCVHFRRLDTLEAGRDRFDADWVFLEGKC
jgi:hypothetical protein